MIFRRVEGFTIVELLVVVAMIVIIASSIIIEVNSLRLRSRDDQRVSGARRIKEALELFYDDNGYYPPTGSSATWNNNLVERSSSVTEWGRLANLLEPYIVRLPYDPLFNGGGMACDPMSDPDCYSYVYGNVHRPEYTPNPIARAENQYDLYINLENANHPLRCEIELYVQKPSNADICTGQPDRYRIIEFSDPNQGPYL